MRSETKFISGRTAVRFVSLLGLLLLALPISPAAISWDETNKGSRDGSSNDVALGYEEGLVELVGPIALYPDDLLALVLPASTFPIQIVLASRFLVDLEQNEAMRPDPDWDPSLLALLNYPEAMALLNQDLEWTWQLGEAVLHDQGIVMDAIQQFRTRVYAVGNLESNDMYRIVREGDAIIVTSADPEVIYVPGYEATRVVVVHSGAPLYWYSPPYPYYYHPWAPFWSGFYLGGIGYGGSAFAYGLSWGSFGHGYYNHHVVVHRHVHTDKWRRGRRDTDRRDSGGVGPENRGPDENRDPPENWESDGSGGSGDSRGSKMQGRRPGNRGSRAWSAPAERRRRAQTGLRSRRFETRSDGSDRNLGQSRTSRIAKSDGGSQRNVSENDKASKRDSRSAKSVNGDESVAAKRRERSAAHSLFSSVRRSNKASSSSAGRQQRTAKRQASGKANSSMKSSGNSGKRGSMGAGSRKSGGRSKAGKRSGGKHRD